MTVEHYWAWDPGQMTGAALFNMSGKPLGIWEADYSAPLTAFLMEIELAAFFVIEEYRNITPDIGQQQRIRYTKRWDKVPAARAIGCIQMRADMLGIPTYYQPANIKGPTAQMFGLPNDRNHMMNAVLHGLRYAKEHLGLRPPELPVPETVVSKTATIVPVSGIGDIAKAMRKARKQSGL